MRKDKIGTGITSLRIATIAFLILFCWVVFNVIFFPRAGIFVPNQLLSSTIAIFVLVLFFLYLRYFNHPARIARKTQNTLIAAAFILITIFHISIGYSLQATPLGWDPAVVSAQAAEVATGIKTTHDSYFLEYQNNIGIFALTTYFYKALLVFGIKSFSLAPIFMNVVAMELAAISIFLVCQKLFGRRLAVLSVPLSFILITLSFWTTTPYTDTLTLVFPISILYLFLIAYEKRGSKRTILLLSATIGSLTAIGYLLKPTVVILPLAIMIILIAVLLAKKRSIKDSLVFLAPTIGASTLTFIAIYTTALFVINASGILPFDLYSSGNMARPMQHWLMIGQQTSYRDYPRPLYGAYTLEDDIRTAGRTSDEVKKIAYKEISVRLSNMGAIGYAQYINNKIIWHYSDGTFYAYGEGIAYKGKLAYVHNDNYSRMIQSVLDLNGKFYNIATNVIHGIWLTILVLICAGLAYVVRAKSLPLPYYICILSIAGLTIFVTLFEGRSRYLYNYVPIFIVLALYTISFLYSRYKRFITLKDSR